MVYSNESIIERTIKIVFQGGGEFIKDNVKFPQAYLEKIWGNSKYYSMSKSEKDHLKVMKLVYDVIYIDGEVIWNSKTSNFLPWYKLNDRLKYILPYDYEDEVDPWDEVRDSMWDHYNPNLDMDQQDQGFYE